MFIVNLARVSCQLNVGTSKFNVILKKHLIFILSGDTSTESNLKINHSGPTIKRNFNNGYS